MVRCGARSREIRRCDTLFKWLELRRLGSQINLDPSCNAPNQAASPSTLQPRLGSWPSRVPKDEDSLNHLKTSRDAMKDGKLKPEASAPFS